MSRQHHRAVFLVFDVLQDVPELTTGVGVQACCRLVQENDLGCRNQGYGYRKASLHAEWQLRSHDVSFFQKLNFFQCLRHSLSFVLAGNSLDASVEQKVVFYGKVVPEDVELGTHTDLKLDYV